MTLSDFERESFEYEGQNRDVYRRGDGPGVVIMHEIPGITPEVAGFARRVADAGFTAVMPHLLGTPGKAMSVPYALQQMAHACVVREFSVLARGESSPITDWLRALCRDTHQRCGGPGVGALGMCLTGNFALSLMVDDAVMAPVLSQPSLPFPVSKSHRQALHLSAADLARVKERVGEGCKVLGLRFTEDRLSPPERFERLREELGEGFEGIEIPSACVEPKFKKFEAHSVVTVHLIDEEGHPTRQALDRVLSFFRERLN